MLLNLNSSDEQVNLIMNLIAKTSMPEVIAQQLREQILSGQFKINQKIPTEPELMKTFGVGRSTIREAIKILSYAGILKVKQGSGIFVEQFSDSQETLAQRIKRANIKDLEEVRQILEIKIVEKAAINRTNQDIEKIRQHLAAGRKAAEQNLLNDCIAADIDFHNAIAEASKNEILSDLYRIASNHLKDWFTYIYPDISSLTENFILHEMLLKAIISRSPKKALKITSELARYRSKKY